LQQDGLGSELQRGVKGKINVCRHASEQEEMEAGFQPASESSATGGEPDWVPFYELFADTVVVEKFTGRWRRQALSILSISFTLRRRRLDQLRLAKITVRKMGAGQLHTSNVHLVDYNTDNRVDQ
jgi:hypothetical protein